MSCNICGGLEVQPKSTRWLAATGCERIDDSPTASSRILAGPTDRPGKTPMSRPRRSHSRSHRIGRTRSLGAAAAYRTVLSRPPTPARAFHAPAASLSPAAIPPTFHRPMPPCSLEAAMQGCLARRTYCPYQNYPSPGNLISRWCASQWPTAAFWYWTRWNRASEPSPLLNLPPRSRAGSPPCRV